MLLCLRLSTESAARATATWPPGPAPRSLSPDEKGDRMGMSLMYQLGGISAAAGDAQGGIRIGDRVVRWGPGIGGDGLDVDNLTRAEVEARLQLWRQVQALRKQPAPSPCYLAQTATGIGVRETRRFLGEYFSPSKMPSGARGFPTRSPSVPIRCRATAVAGPSSTMRDSTFPIVRWFRRRSTVCCSPGGASLASRHHFNRPGPWPPPWPWDTPRAVPRHWPPIVECLREGSTSRQSKNCLSNRRPNSVPTYPENGSRYRVAIAYGVVVATRRAARFRWRRARRPGARPTWWFRRKKPALGLNWPVEASE